MNLKSEVIMRRTAFIITLFFILFVSANAFTEVDDTYQKGLKYFYSGNYEEAARHLTDYVKKNPKASVYYKIGYALYELGRHDEAHKYFEQAYLVEPEFSPIPSVQRPAEMPEREIPEMPAVAPEVRYVPEEVILPEEMPKGTTEPDIPPPVFAPEEPVIAEQEMAPEQEPQVPGEVKIPSEQQFDFDKTFEPPKDFPKQMDEPKMSKGLMAAAAGLNILSLIMSIAFWVFMALCLFRIGKKLDVPNSWLAWVPFIQNFWPMVGAGGKSVWWGLTYLVGIPIIGGIIAGVFAMISPMLALIVLGAIGIVFLWAYIHLWMNISEGLGKERLLGLLMLLPLINLIFMGYLAFSESG
jgi:hypothetical protein